MGETLEHDPDIDWVKQSRIPVDEGVVVMDLNDLIARLKQATGPSRELDEQIAALCHPTDEPFLAAFENGRDYPDLYTSSIDAALSLVPEGWRVSHFEQMRSPREPWAPLNEWSAVVERQAPYGIHGSCWWIGQQRHDAKGAAIAITIAALKARGDGQ